MLYRPPTNTACRCIAPYTTGATALVQFCVWERGQVDLPHLHQRLVQAMRHAVCDVVMEYRLLTAPLCEVPLHYARGLQSPLHSAPPSPSCGSRQEAGEEGLGVTRQEAGEGGLGVTRQEASEEGLGVTRQEAGKEGLVVMGQEGGEEGLGVTKAGDR